MFRENYIQVNPVKMFLFDKKSDYTSDQGII